VFGTLHTQSAADAVDRLVDVFPEGRQRQIRLQLSMTLVAVLSQQLLPKPQGGRACACEVMIVNHAIRNLIREGKTPQIEKAGDTIVFSVTGKPIVPRSENQLKLVKEYEENDMIFAIGPAGSGKTYTAIALAVRSLKNKEIKKIILSRPAVEAGEKLGFLPGDMKDKIDPYLQPLYDALQDMIPAAKLKEYMELNIIQIAPLAFMRGRTLNDAVVILDEAQNTTTQQIKMFLTRMGMNTKMIVTGDMTQIDLPSSQKSGLVQAMHILKGVKGISFIELNKKDIVRHKLVTRIVEAYEKFEEKQKEKRDSSRCHSERSEESVNTKP
jgi:phosphate starvation-inducible PhoH-like protein